MKIEIAEVRTIPESDPYTGGTTHAEFWLSPQDLHGGIAQVCRTGATDADVYHNRVLTADIPNPDLDAARDYLHKEAQELMLDVCAGHSIDWDGHNHVGTLTEEAELIWQILIENLSTLPESPWQLWDLDDYLQHAMPDTEGRSDFNIQAIANKIESDAYADHVVFSEDVFDYLKSQEGE